MSIKNLWSLNIDEALVADKLKSVLSKTDYEVFFPINSQMKDIDLLLVGLEDYKTVSVQVKGSRTFPPNESEVKKYGTGSAAWFRISKSAIFTPRNKVDFFVLVTHSFAETEFKKSIVVNYLVIPAKEFQNLVKQKKELPKSNFYNFYIWVDPNEKRAFDFRNTKDDKYIDLNEYLDNWQLFEKTTNNVKSTKVSVKPQKVKKQDWVDSIIQNVNSTSFKYPDFPKN